MLKVHPISVRVTTMLLLLLALGFAAEPRRVVVYAPQVNYQLDILVRDGVDYVGITDLLEPLGRIESRIEGKKLILIFNGGAAEFQDGKRQYRTRSNNKLELASNFLLADNRGYIPEASITQLLSSIAGQGAEFHPASRRLFIGATQFHYSAELRRAPSRLVLSFPTPVNPSSLVERSRVRLLFYHEPVVSSGADNVSYGDQFLAGTSFTEIPGGAEFIANILQPATVSISDGGHTVTIAALPPPPTPAPVAPAAPTATQAANQARPTVPVPRSRPFVILDAAHGGDETGAVLSPTLLEKNVNLILARRLQKELDARGIPVVLTRVADNLLTSDQRAISANTSRASLYVAIHSSSSGHGVRVYTSMVGPPQAVRSKRSFVPWELAQSPYLEQSAMAAAALVAECNAGGVPVRSAAAPLRPLNSVTAAAIAVEVAPQGNSPDELGSAEYQQKIVAAVASGIASLRGKLEAAQ